MRRSLGGNELGPPDLEIGRMRRRHLKGVLAIEREVYPRPWSPNLFLSEMSETRNRTYLVARLGRDVVGYAGAMHYGEESHVTTIAVDPRHHRHRIGTRLLYDVMLAARDQGSQAVSLEVRMSNWGAQRMYGRFGFRPVGVRKGYYQETNEDALVMWADDIDGDDYERLLKRISGAAASRADGDRDRAKSAPTRRPDGASGA